MVTEQQGKTNNDDNRVRMRAETSLIVMLATIQGNQTAIIPSLWAISPLHICSVSITTLLVFHPRTPVHVRYFLSYTDQSTTLTIDSPTIPIKTEAPQRFLLVSSLGGICMWGPIVQLGTTSKFSVYGYIGWAILKFSDLVEPFSRIISYINSVFSNVRSKPFPKSSHYLVFTSIKSNHKILVSIVLLYSTL